MKPICFSVAAYSDSNCDFSIVKDVIRRSATFPNNFNSLFKDKHKVNYVILPH